MLLRASPMAMQAEQEPTQMHGCLPVLADGTTQKPLMSYLMSSQKQQAE